MFPADPTNTDSDLFADLLPEETPAAPRKPRRRKPKSPKPPAEPSASESPALSSVLAPDPFWAKVEALWAERGIQLRPKVIMRTDPKTGKTVFTNTELVPELAPQQEEAHWAASPSSGQSVTQPPGGSTAKTPSCGTSPAFCGTSKTPSTPAVSSDRSGSHTVRPQSVSSAEPSTANPSFCDTSSDFCDASKTPLNPVFTGFGEDSPTSRPHKAHSNEFVTAKKAVCDANPTFYDADAAPAKPINASNVKASDNHRPTSAVSESSVTQPPGESTAKTSNCGPSSVFCDTLETPTTSVVSGLVADSNTARPHDTVSQTTSSGRDAMELQNDDPPEVRLKKLALKIFQNGGSYKTVAGNLGISRDKARTWKRLWQIGRFEDNIRGIRFSGDYPEEIKAKVRERLQAGATPGELEKEFQIPRQTIRKWKIDKEIC